MALEANGSVTRQTVPPVSYVTAVWLGMSPDDIAHGIAEGIIDAPPGWSGSADPVATSSHDARTRTTSDEALTLDHPQTGSNVEQPVADRDRVRGLFRSIDAALADSAFDQIWTRAGDTDAHRAGNLEAYLSRALLGPSAAGNGMNAGSETDVTPSLQAFVAESNHRGQVVDLSGKSGEELATLGKADAGYRYALLNLDSIAIVGNGALQVGNNASGQLDRFDANTGEQNFSDAWLADRAKLLAWKLASDGGGSTTIDGTEAWSFLDHRTADAEGIPYQLDLSSQTNDGPTNTVVFGDDAATGELLKGGAGTDRIYGGGGDDVLRGNAGDDHLEGGRGDDLVMGGLGSDDLSGDQGADELEGGAGNDRLRGDAGDDVLTGGRGDDRVEGGSGHDTYVVDPGDGTDTIVDSDSDGEIRFDGQALTAATDRQGNDWISADGRVRFSFSGDAVDGGTLNISFYRTTGAAGGTAPDNVTKVTDWHNGDLGIVLGDGSTAALAIDDTPTDLSAEVDLTAVRTVPMHDPGTSGNDGQGSTWIEPVDITASGTGDDAADTNTAQVSADDLAGLFSDLDTTATVGSTLVTADSVHAGLMSWAGVQEAPDISSMVSVASATSVGLTPHDMTSALLDFHDGGHDLADQAAVTTMPAPNVIDVLQTGEVGSAVTRSGSGVGNMHRRGG